MSRKLAFLLILGAVALAACGVIPKLSENPTAEETESAELVIESGSSIEIVNFAGAITTREGEPGRILATVVKESRLADEADAQAQLEEVTLIVEQTAGGARVEVDGPDNMDNLQDMQIGLTGRLEVIVPPGADLTINLGAGEIILDRPTGDVDANSGAGEATAILPADASFHLKVSGGATAIESEFDGVPGGGVAVDVDTTVGDNPTQSLVFQLGAGKIILQKAD